MTSSNSVKKKKNPKASLNGNQRAKVNRADVCIVMYSTSAVRCVCEQLV